MNLLKRAKKTQMMTCFQLKIEKYVQQVYHSSLEQLCSHICKHASCLSKSQPINININKIPLSRAEKTINGRKMPNINKRDPFVQIAAEKLGISFDELQYPTLSDLNTYTKNPKFRDYVNNRLCDRVDERINKINEESKKLRDENERAKTAPVISRNVAGLKDEKEERVHDKSKKEVEDLIKQSLLEFHQSERRNKLQEFLDQKNKHFEDNMKNVRKKEKEDYIQRKKEYEAKEKEQRKDEIEKRLKEMEEEKRKNKKILKEERIKRKEMLEEARKQQLMEQKLQMKIKKRDILQKEKADILTKQLEEKNKKHQERVEEEQAALKKKHEEDNLKRKIAFDKVTTNNKMIMDELRKQLEMKEQKHQDFIHQYQLERERKMEEKEQKNRQKLERQKEFQLQKEEEKRQMAQRLDERDMAIENNLKQKENERLEKIKMARQNQLQIMQKLTEKKNEYIEALENMQRENDNKILSEQKAFLEKQKKFQEEQEFKMLKDKIDSEERHYAALQAHRVTIAKFREKERRYNSHIQQLEETNQNQTNKIHQKLKDKANEDISKADTYEKVKKLIHNTSAQDINELRALANKFNINYDSLYETTPNAPKISISQYITQLGGKPGLRDNIVNSSLSTKSNSIKELDENEQNIVQSINTEKDTIKLDDYSNTQLSNESQMSLKNKTTLHKENPASYEQHILNQNLADKQDSSSKISSSSKKRIRIRIKRKSNLNSSSAGSKDFLPFSEKQQTESSLNNGNSQGSVFETDGSKSKSTDFNENETDCSQYKNELD